MRLSTRYIRVNLLASLIILLISAFTYYIVISHILLGVLDDNLKVEEQEIVEFTEHYHHLPPAGNFKEQIVQYRRVKKPVKRKFEDTDYVKKAKHHKEPGRSLTTSVSLDGSIYEVKIIKSKVESEDLIKIIFFITLAVTGLLLISLTLINRFALAHLWKPFYSILSQMKAFNVAENKELNIEKTSIDEFVELNKAALALSLRVRQDYRELKTFTDNASHEMMTPLAVINSKLDTFLQTGTFKPEQGELLEDIYNGVSRLSRLNQSLLLITKMENQLIKDKEKLNLKSLIEQKIKQFHELLLAENISIEYSLTDSYVVMSKYLADILLNNLFSNAIKHNKKGGVMAVELTDSKLVISNSGDEQSIDAEKAFERFYKNTASEGMGLGLAISKQICSTSGFALSYQYGAGMHHFSIQLHL